MDPVCGKAISVSRQRECGMQLDGKVSRKARKLSTDCVGIRYQFVFSHSLPMKLPLRFEMTTTRADFLRLLPAAVNHVAFAEKGDAFFCCEGARGWRIGFQSLPQLRIGLVRLDRYRVDFEFTGYSEDEIDAFMARFELYFRRGGG